MTQNMYLAMEYAKISERRGKLGDTRGQTAERMLCPTKGIPGERAEGQEVANLWSSFNVLALMELFRIMIVIDLDVLEELGQCDKIGEPKALEAKEDEETTAQPVTISSNGFYGNQIPAQKQGPTQSLPSRAGDGRGGSSAHATIFPIEGLSPYAHKWTIKARCTHKGEIRHWHNKNGEGKLFSVNFLDETGEIRATGFNDQCDALYDVFQEGSVYYISSPCKVQLAKKQFTNLNNDYELTFERDTAVEKVCSIQSPLSYTRLI